MLDAELRLVSKTPRVIDVRLDGGYRCGERITEKTKSEVENYVYVSN